MVATRIHHREPLIVEASYYRLHPDRTAAQNATALLDAQAALPSGRGGTIVIDASDADYYLDAFPTLASGQQIVGRGPRATRLRTDSLTEHGLKIQGASANSTTALTAVRDLALIGPGKASGGTGDGIHIKWGSFGLLFENVWLYDWGRHGAYCEDTYQTTWRSCAFQSNGGDGFHGLTNINAFELSSCRALSNGGAGVQVVGGSGVAVMALNAEDNGTYGLDLRYVQGAVVFGCDFERNTLAHLYLHWRSGAGEKANAVTVHGNNFTGTAITPTGVLVDGANICHIGDVNAFGGHTTEDIKLTANATRTMIGTNSRGGANPVITDASASTVYDRYDLTNLMQSVAPGLLFAPRSASPPALAEGMVWYRGDLDQLRLHDGTRIRTLFSGLQTTATVDPASIAATSTGTFTVTVTGAATTDSVRVTAPADLSSGLSIDHAYVSAADTVTVRLRNHTGNAIDQGSGSWIVVVTKV